jgi:hypothetical protein
MEGAVERVIGVFSKRNGEHGDPIGEACSPGVAKVERVAGDPASSHRAAPRRCRFKEAGHDRNA